MKYQHGVPYIFNLLNGMEIIAKVEREETDSVFLENALIFIQRQTEQGYNVALQPVANFSEINPKGSSICLHNNAIVFTYQPRNDIVNVFNEMTGSIILASAIK